MHIGVILREQGSREAAEVRFTRDCAGCAVLIRKQIRRSGGHGGRATQAVCGRTRRKRRGCWPVPSTERTDDRTQGLPCGEPADGHGRVDEVVSGAAAAAAQPKTKRTRGDPSEEARRVERGGVWDFLRKRITASEYTRPGDPLGSILDTAQWNHPCFSMPGQPGAWSGDGQGACVVGGWLYGSCKYRGSYQ